MYRECRHIKDDGLRCRSGALKGKPYCYFHMKLKRMDRQPSIQIPMLEDSTSVLLGIGQVMRMLTLDTMEMKRASLMLYGLQIASCVIKQREQAKPAEYVRSVHDEAGNDIDLSEAMIHDKPALAPESIVCEPPQDCANCEQKSTCTRLAQLKRETAAEQSSNNGTASSRPQVPLPEGVKENSPEQAQRNPGSAPPKSSSRVGPPETLRRIAAAAVSQERCEDALTAFSHEAMTTSLSLTTPYSLPPDLRPSVQCDPTHKSPCAVAHLIAPAGANLFA